MKYPFRAKYAMGTEMPEANQSESSVVDATQSMPLFSVVVGKSICVLF